MSKDDDFIKPCKTNHSHCIWHEMLRSHKLLVMH